MDDLTEAERAALTAWTSEAFDEAVAASYVIPPWRPTLQASQTLDGYYKPVLTPAEAAQAMFATRH
jgi:hypothetical protein